MSLLLKAASGNSVVTTGWTNPTNAQALQPDNSNATAEPATSSDVISDFTFPAILDAEIPVGSTINSVKILVDLGGSVLSGATVGFRGYNNGVADSNAEFNSASGAQTRLSFTFGTTPSITDLKTASRIAARVRASKGATAGTMAAVLDDVVLAIDYTPPAQQGWSVVFAGQIGPNGGTNHTQRQITIPSLAVGDAVFVSSQRSAPTNDVASDTISDSVGNDYTAHRVSNWDTTNHQSQVAACCIVSNAGTNVVVTVGYAGGTNHPYDNFKVLVMRNSNGPAVFDKSTSTANVTASGSGNDTMTVGPLTPAAANSVIVAAFENTGSGKAIIAGTSPNAFLTDAQTNSTATDPGADGLIEHFVQTTAASISATASEQSASGYMGVLWVVGYTSTGGSQFSRPSADTATGGWTRGGTDSGTLFGQIDETTASDADYITATAS